MKLQASSAVRAPNPNSTWRIITPYLMLPFLTPSLVLAYACATGQGPWARGGYFGPGNHLVPTLFLLVPLAVWSASWLLDWEGEHDMLESRVIAGLWAIGLSFLICAAFTVAMFMTAFLAGLGPALA